MGLPPPWRPTQLYGNDIDRLHGANKQSMPLHPANFGRRSTLASEYIGHTTPQAVDPCEASPWATGAGRKKSNIHAAPSAPNDSLTALIQQRDPTSSQSQPVLPTKRTAPDPLHPAASLLQGHGDALDAFIVRRQSSRYGKKAAASGYRQQETNAMANQWRSDGQTAGGPAQPPAPPLPPGTRLLAPTQQTRARASVHASGAPGSWAYGALGGR